MIRPQTYDFTAAEGRAQPIGGFFTAQFQFVTETDGVQSDPIDLTGITFTAEVRTKPNREGELIATMGVTVSNGEEAYPSLVTCLILQQVTELVTKKKDYWDLRGETVSGAVTYYLKGKYDFEGTVTEG